MHESTRALVSIHDVMPSSFDDVLELIDLCQESGILRPTLLIVPGLEWSAKQIDRIRDWADQGFELAGHGWIHRHDQVKTWWHRFHSLFLSRNVAEHLSLTTEEVVQLMQRCGEWFHQQRIPLPSLYVPPAWALGDLPADRVGDQPFEMIETFRGLQIENAGFRAIPLLGYEADSWLRVAALSAFNRWNQVQAQRTGVVRVSIHPFDHKLMLRRELQRHLHGVQHAITYANFRAQLT